MLADQQQRSWYQRIRARHTPKAPVVRNLFLAFVVGGSLTAIGQIFMDFFLGHGAPLEKAGAYTAVVIVLLGALLTGLGIYDEIVRIGGMGATLPISGFANAVASAALEYRREGWILGVGAKIFTIAGPVLVYGILGSIVVGIMYLILHIPIPGGTG